MLLHALDHVTVRTDDIGRTARFYEDLGMTPGPRPPFAIPGRWLYAGEHALVHILATSEGLHPGRIDHAAFAARGRAEIEARLRRRGDPFRLQPLPDGSGLQLFMQDPDGVRLELVFRDREDQ